MENEIWQVEVNGQIYETNFRDLKQWIQERSLLPQDNVRKGNMRWIQTGRVPALRRIFDGETAQVGVTTAPVAESIAAIPEPPTVFQQSEIKEDSPEPAETFAAPTPVIFTPAKRLFIFAAIVPMFFAKNPAGMSSKFQVSSSKFFDKMF